MFFSKMWSWIKQAWTSFESWVASWIPGFKVKLVSLLGALGNAAFVMKDYVAGIPADAFVTPVSLIIINTVLFTLAFWLRGLSKYNE